MSERYEEGRFLSSTGAQLFYRDFGPVEGGATVPLLCLHGFLRSSRDFSELGRTFSGLGIRLIAPDLRGRGLSATFTSAADYHYDLIKQDVWDLLDHLGIDKVVVLGIALGALLAMDMATENPERIRGIVLNDQGTEINQSASNKMSGNFDTHAYPFDEAVSRMKMHFGDSYPGLTHARWEDLTLRAYREIEPGKFARDVDPLSLADVPRLKAERPDNWPQYRATRDVPTAILRGELSEYFTADCAERMLVEHPNATLTTVKGRGHPPLMDEPEALAAIKTLLELASSR
ncbi:alpha/beta hydrolase [Pseudomonas sp. FP597]|uniref:Alpha/beta hydrolase n=1 Tax=Pseudomonas lactucae TaxID=2813360 RepID=A0A9X0Y9Z6_9PSED|nr:MULTISPECIES: alpha/beta hydrolase [Pseudomonas]MBN2975751.1 alpha/beta hydrolase [Pseudomonas lactucae]MBN2985923.1 alpha/beta hydrolase [Pseudomonas lactucae]WLI08869.1 alpha/beta hydrolase [Pseudomonas sp. FP597]